jgi:1,4-alpha-glucan branching enzyme
MWIEVKDVEQSIIILLRRSVGRKTQLAVFNFTPVMHESYRVGAPFGGEWKEILNSDAKEYGGSGFGNQGMALAEPAPIHNQRFSLNLVLPPLSALFFKHG